MAVVPGIPLSFEVAWSLFVIVSFAAPWVWEGRKNERILRFANGVGMRLKEADVGAEGVIRLAFDNGVILDLDRRPGLSTDEVTLTFWRFTDGHAKSLAPSLVQYKQWRRQPWDTALIRPLNPEDPRMGTLTSIQGRLECGPVQLEGLWRQKPKDDDPESAILGIFVSASLRDWTAKAARVAMELDAIKALLESVTGDALNAPKAWWGRARRRYSPLPPRASDPRPRA